MGGYYIAEEDSEKGVIIFNVASDILKRRAVRQLEPTRESVKQSFQWAELFYEQWIKMNRNWQRAYGESKKH